MTMVLSAVIALTVKSPMFAAGAELPAVTTCEGKDVAPPIEWSGAPAGTKSFAIVVDDPDAPDPKAPKMTWVHWVAYDLPADAKGVPEGGKLPAGARDGLNDWKQPGYRGPCPPIGRHRYFFKVYALDTVLGDLKNPSKAQVEKAMEGHILGKGELIGTYQKRGKK
jgi:Raf kinase inhibitor-like YbhB/YbcL family protein